MKQKIFMFIFIVIISCYEINGDSDATSEEMKIIRCPEIRCQAGYIVVRDPHGRRCPRCVKDNSCETTTIPTTREPCPTPTCGPCTIYAEDPTGEINDGCPYCAEDSSCTTTSSSTTTTCAMVSCRPGTEYYENPGGCPYCSTTTTSTTTEATTTEKECEFQGVNCPIDYYLYTDAITGCRGCKPCPTPTCPPGYDIEHYTPGKCPYCVKYYKEDESCIPNNDDYPEIPKMCEIGLVCVNGVCEKIVT